MILPFRHATGPGRDLCALSRLAALEISLRDDERDEDVVRDDFIWPHAACHYARRGPDRAAGGLLFRSKISDKWRDRRCFCGRRRRPSDATFPGAGKCAGIRDAANLVELAAVLRWGA